MHWKIHFSWDVPEQKPSSYWGRSIVGNLHLSLTNQWESGGNQWEFSEPASATGHPKARIKKRALQPGSQWPGQIGWWDLLWQSWLNLVDLCWSVHLCTKHPDPKGSIERLWLWSCYSKHRTNSQHPASDPELPFLTPPSKPADCEPKSKIFTMVVSGCFGCQRG